MRCPQSRPATISCRQTMAMSKPSGGVAAGIGAAGIGAAGGAGERIRLNVPIIDAHDQRPSAKYAGGRTVHLSGFGCSRVPKSQPGSQAIRVVRLPELNRGIGPIS